MKLDAKQVAVIRGLLNIGLPASKVARLFPKVRYQAIYEISTGKSWKDVEPATLSVVDQAGNTFETTTERKG